MGGNSLLYTFASGVVAGAIRGPATEKETYGALRVKTFDVQKLQAFETTVSARSLAACSMRKQVAFYCLLA
jgi:hypothetical protein